MPRFARPHVTGGLFHVISRFHGRSYFMDLEGARQNYLRLLGRAVEKYDTRVLAYCLMSSHVHLVLQLGLDPLGAFTRSVHSGWAVWVNRRHNGLGAVMSDRPRSLLVHADSYGYELIRYVHNNPVRAGLVNKAQDSFWSSHRAYLGLEKIPDWLDTQPLLGKATKTRQKRQREFEKFVCQGRGELQRPEFSGQVSHDLARRIRQLIGGPVEISFPVLGPDEFIRQVYGEQVQKNSDIKRSVDTDITAQKVLEALCEDSKFSIELLCSRTRRSEVTRKRALFTWLWCVRFGRPQVEVAEQLGISASAVSGLLGKLYTQGMSIKENQLVERVWDILTTEKNNTLPSKDATKTMTHEPQVLILKRNRKKK